MRDPRFTTEREKLFYRGLWVFVLATGISMASIGLYRLLMVGGKEAWGLILAGASIPLCHFGYERFGMALSKAGIAIYEYLKRR